MYRLLLLLLLLQSFANCSINSADVGVKRGNIEESIPIIEIRGEGAPMSSAQIRHLEELDNGGPLDIKIDKTFVPAKCGEKAKRLDFITFHYKVFTEDNKKVHQTYGLGPVTIQLGTGMIMPGLDKGLKGMCEAEMRKIQVPYRLSRKPKTKVWKSIPNDENWLTFNIEMLKVRPYSLEEQFNLLDLNNNTRLDAEEMINWQKKMKKEFGKTWRNEDIDTNSAAKYYIRYFDVNNDGNVTKSEWISVMKRDEKLMEQTQKNSKEKGRKRDPGIAWILDFNNDGIVTAKELDEAPDLFEKEPKLLPTNIKDEL
ncbi:unnamed protein product [Caenorhabditis bovis]|uniref:peptidylprolyl isomerase n=1 Tax=Caenorhabditis bovis TaxID=2654633 RepID=A0A8S1F8S0_9PELO|nr:unnamed protein product [Caenorhabditis bovis]